MPREGIVRGFEKQKKEPGEPGSYEWVEHPTLSEARLS
jgi:hypothetical protein